MIVSQSSKETRLLHYSIFGKKIETTSIFLLGVAAHVVGWDARSSKAEMDGRSLGPAILSSSTSPRRRRLDGLLTVNTPINFCVQFKYTPWAPLYT